MQYNFFISPFVNEETFCFVPAGRSVDQVLSAQNLETPLSESGQAWYSGYCKHIDYCHSRNLSPRREYLLKDEQEFIDQIRRLTEENKDLKKYAHHNVDNA